LLACDDGTSKFTKMNYMCNKQKCPKIRFQILNSYQVHVCPNKNLLQLESACYG